MTGCRSTPRTRSTRTTCTWRRGPGRASMALTTAVTDVRPSPAGATRVTRHRTGNRSAGILVHRRARRLRRQRPRHPDPAAPAQAPVAAAACRTGSGELSRTNSEAVLSARSTNPDRRLHAGHWRSRRRSTPTTADPRRAGALRARVERCSRCSTRTSSTRSRACRAGARPCATYRARGFGGGRPHARARRWAEQSVIVLVMQSLDNSITTYPEARRVRVAHDHAPGSRRAQPRVDPHRPSHRARPRRAASTGSRGARSADLVGIPLTAHFIGGCVIGTSITRGRHRPVPARVRLRRSAHLGRLGHHRQPRGQPVADDHGAGRAGDGVLAQQGRRRPAPAPRRGVRAHRRGRAAASGRSRDPPRVRCGCRCRLCGRARAGDDSRMHRLADRRDRASSHDAKRPALPSHRRGGARCRAAARARQPVAGVRSRSSPSLERTTACTPSTCPASAPSRRADCAAPASPGSPNGSATGC